MTSFVPRMMPRRDLQALLDTLKARGFDCIGPRVRDGAIVYEHLERMEDLPRGVRDEQTPGEYRLRPQTGDRLFAWANGPAAVKPLAFASREVLWRADRDADGNMRFAAVAPGAPRLAVIGARSCDLAALSIQDRVFLQTGRADPYYQARRDHLFLVVVNCTHPASTCFCASTGDGPQAEGGFDLALTEVDDGFVCQAGGAAGEELLQGMGLAPAPAAWKEQASAQIQEAARAQTRRLPGRNLRNALFDNLEHERWQEVAERCLSCGNCTQVCPTCFCHSEAEEPALGAAGSSHTRQWDSCFTHGHSYIHGFTVRPSTLLRYRQWLTHKLGSWHDQFGRSGCVGCGRCITWCPVGIDITEEAAAICGEVIDG